MEQTMLAFNSCFCHSLLLLQCLFLFFPPFIYSLNVWGLMNDGKGWSLRHIRKVAPVSSHSLQQRCVSITMCFVVKPFASHVKNTKILNGYYLSSKSGLKHWAQITKGCKSSRSQIWDTIGTSKMKICHLGMIYINIQRKPIRLWMVKALWMIFLSLFCVSNPCCCFHCFTTNSHHEWMPNLLQYHSKSLFFCSYFHTKCILDVHLPPRNPFTGRLGLVLKLETG